MTQQKILRVYADGVFDGFHIGHSNMFKQCRQAFPNQNIWLIAGVHAQDVVELHKGPMINSEQQRIQMVAQNRYVDEAMPKAPWILTQEFLTKHNIDFVAHDDIPYVTAGIEDAYALPKRLEKFKATQRTKGISTTDVVGKILRNKDMYYVRNLKRGVPRDKLGMTIFRFIKLKVMLMICPHRFDHLKKIDPITSIIVIINTTLEIKYHIQTLLTSRLSILIIKNNKINFFFSPMNNLFYQKKNFFMTYLIICYHLQIQIYKRFKALIIFTLQSD